MLYIAPVFASVLTQIHALISSEGTGLWLLLFVTSAAVAAVLFTFVAVTAKGRVPRNEQPAKAPVFASEIAQW